MEPDQQPVLHHPELVLGLKGAGICLLGIFLTVQLANTWPPALLQPVWQQQWADNLQASGIYALLGATLIVTSHALDPASAVLQRRVFRMRRGCACAATAWLLLIPLQVQAGVRILHGLEAQEAGEMRRNERIIAAIPVKKSAAELRTLLAAIPGFPPVPDPLAEPLPAVRALLVRRLSARQRQLEKDLRSNASQRWAGWRREILKDGMTSLFFWCGFSSLSLGPRSAGREPAAQDLR